MNERGCIGAHNERMAAAAAAKMINQSAKESRLDVWLRPIVCVAVVGIRDDEARERE